MCPGESAGRSAGQGGPADLASAILARIAGGDLPAGVELDPARLSLLFSATRTDVTDALGVLQAHGAVSHDKRGWRVAESRDGQGRDLLHWAVPLLRAVLSLAAERITPAEAAGLLAAYDRYAGLAGDGTLSTRAEGYRLMMQRLALASASRFHVGSVDGFLDRAEPILQRMAAHRMASRRTAEPDDELGRLAGALMQGNAQAAVAALEDHLILLGRYLDCPEPIGP